MTHLAFHGLQLFLVILTGLSNVSIPRRPEIFGPDSRPITGQSTYSALSKYTFAWGTPLLVLAGKKKTLDLEDLPRPDHHTRAESLSNAWASRPRIGKLWKLVFWAHPWAFILQWTLTLAQSFVNFAPQFVMLNVLRLLEKRQDGDAVGFQAWIWILCLGLSIMTGSWIDAWLFWISWSQLALPARAQLSALIFQKAMRRKDVKGTTKAKGMIVCNSNLCPASVGDHHVHGRFATIDQ